MSRQHRKKTTSSSTHSGAGDLRVIELNSYVRPKVSEGTWNPTEWVEYGEDNNYFGYVTDRYFGSPTNNALVNSITDMIYGGGLRIEGSEDTEKLDELFPPQDVARICFDFKHQGQAAFEVITEGDTKTCNHIPVSTLRPNKVNEDGDIIGYWFSSDWEGWENNRREEYTPVFIPAYGFDGEKSGKEIMYIKRYSPDNFYFSPPDYQGALPYAELEEEIANYHINNIKNGFTPSTVINYNNGVPPKTERDLIERNTREKFTGTNNAGRILIAFNESADNAVTMDSYQLHDAPNQSSFISEEARKHLMV